MCGFFGVLDPDGLPDRPVLDRMGQAIVHRGPDQSGLFVDGPVALGSQRLAILDLSEAGSQPLFSEDERFVLVYNGETYNFDALRAELSEDGVRFRSRSDTEVVLQTLLADGLGALERFHGMLALALWDRVEQTLLLARGRFGIKPLYLYEEGNRVAFASELKALLALPGVSREIDAEALGLYLTLGYIPGPRTLFARIRKLPPAHCCLLRPGQRATATPYWRLVERERIGEEPEADFDAILHRVVAAHLSADVPVGLFLSGGLDSTALAIAISNLGYRRFKTFSVGFRDETYSEAPYARQVSEALGTEHHELLIEPDALELLPRILWHLEEPLADTSILPMWHLCEAAAREVKVVLAGEGGDEVFAGYTRYVWAPVATAYERLPHLFRERLLPQVAELLPAGERRGPGSMVRRIRKFVDTGRLDLVPRYLAWFALVSEDERRELFPRAGGDALSLFAQKFVAARAADPLRRLQHVDIHTQLVDSLLLKGDKVSMAHSLELRVPFLDPELTQFAYNLPRRWKVRGATTKFLLRQWLRRRAPKEVSRRKKQGLEAPVGRWFRGDGSRWARELLLGGELRERGLLREEAANTLLARHQTGHADLGHQIFALVVLEHFFQIFSPGELA